MYPIGMSGAVYNHYLAKQMDLSTDELRTIVKKWEQKSLVGKVVSCLNPFANQEMILASARDLIEARENPQSEVAQKIGWKIEAYRTERA